MFQHGFVPEGKLRETDPAIDKNNRWCNGNKHTVIVCFVFYDITVSSIRLVIYEKIFHSHAREKISSF